LGGRGNQYRVSAVRNLSKSRSLIDQLDRWNLQRILEFCRIRVFNGYPRHIVFNLF
jgi:hypothetical protein